MRLRRVECTGGVDCPTVERRPMAGSSSSPPAWSGSTWRNVHVVRTPLSDYLRYAFEWGYTYNFTAGQDVRVLDLTESPHLAALASAKDFYVIDGEHAVQMVYAADGRYEGAVAISADGVAGYAALAELAYQLATPFTPWWESHPEFHRTAGVA